MNARLAHVPAQGNRAGAAKYALLSAHRSRTRTSHLRVNATKQPNPIPPDAKNIFIFGLGYTSIALGNWLAADGWRVSGTCRSLARVEALGAKGWKVGIYDPARGLKLTPDLSCHLERSPYVLSSIPPLALALYDPALSAQKALLSPLAASGRIAWFGYLSSTGVYGDWQGEWVDESSPCRQTSSKAIVRQEAEAAWLQMYEQYGLPTHIFRLGGIYGPGRSVLDAVQREMSELSTSQQRRGRQRYTARCHVHDICAVLATSILKPRPGGVYNVVDDDSAPRTEVMSYARSLLAGGQGQGSCSNVTSKLISTAQSLPHSLTPAVTATAAAAVLSAREGQSSERIGIDGPGDIHSRSVGSGRGSGPEPLEEKRVRNRLIKSELGLELRYPTYREGVVAIHRGEYWPLTEDDLRMLL